MRPYVALAGVLLAAAGCVPARTSNLFPLKKGNSWTYEIRYLQADQSWKTDELRFEIDGEAEGELGEQRYLLAGKDTWFVRRGRLVGYAVDPAIWTVHLDGSLRVGSEWPAARVSDAFEGPQKYRAAPGEDARSPRMIPERTSGTKTLTARNVKVKVPAGTFRRCVRVDHNRGLFQGVKYYAPGTGMIKSELYAVSRDGQQRTLVTVQSLTKYHIAK